MQKLTTQGAATLVERDHVWSEELNLRPLHQGSVDHWIHVVPAEAKACHPRVRAPGGQTGAACTPTECPRPRLPQTGSGLEDGAQETTVATPGEVEDEI